MLAVGAHALTSHVSCEEVKRSSRRLTEHDSEAAKASSRKLFMNTDSAQLKRGYAAMELVELYIYLTTKIWTRNRGTGHEPSPGDTHNLRNHTHLNLKHSALQYELLYPHACGCVRFAEVTQLRLF